GARCDRAHGAILAVLFPAWMSYIQTSHPDLFYELGRGVFGIAGGSKSEVGERAIGEVRAFARALGLPSSLEELGLNGDSEFESIAAACGQTTVSGTIGNLRRLTTAEIVEVLEIATRSSTDEYANRR